MRNPHLTRQAATLASPQLDVPVCKTAQLNLTPLTDSLDSPQYVFPKQMTRTTANLKRENSDKKNNRTVVTD